MAKEYLLQIAIAFEATNECSFFSISTYIYLYLYLYFYSLVKDWKKNRRAKVLKIYQFLNLETIMKSRISTVCFVYHVAAHR